MAGEKYIVAAAENPLQITVRNILNPAGFNFLSNCQDSLSLMRLVRSYNPDFIVVDANLQFGELKHTLETVDEELLCASIIIGEYRDPGITGLMEKSKAISVCPKPVNRDMLIPVTEMAIMNYRRVCKLSSQLKEVTESYETRKALERAKSILMDRDGLSENEAYTRIRKKSMDSRMSMKAIADAIIFTYDIMSK